MDLGKEITKKLAESIIGSIPDGLDVVDENFNVVYQNKVMKRLAPAAGKKCYQAYKDDKRRCANCPLNRQIKIGETRTIEVGGIAKGKTFLISHTGIVLDGKKHILENFKDISEQKLSRELLELERSKLRSILDTMRDEVYIVNRNLEIEYVNPAMEKILGEVKGRKCYEYLHDFKSPCRECNLKEIISGKTLFREWYYPKTGRTYEFLATPIKNSDGSVSKLHISHDITKRKKLEDDLRTGLERNRSYIELTGQIGWTTNAAGEVVEDIPSWRKFTGQTAEEAMGWGWTSALHPDDLKRVTIAWVEALKSKKKHEIQYRLRRHDGVYRYFLVRVAPVFKADGQASEWVGTCIDITEREQTEKKMEHLASFPRLNPNPVIETDCYGNIRFFNEATVKTLAALSAGYNAAVFLPDVEKIYRELKNNPEKTLYREVKVKNRIFAESIVGPENLGVVRFYLIDITEQKKNEMKLSWERKIIDTIIENTDALLVYFDKDFNFVWVNSMYANLCFRKIDELVGQNYFSLFPNKDTEALFNQAGETGQTIKVKGSPFVYPDKPELEVTYWDWMLTPIKDLTGKIQGYVYSVLDVTDTKKLFEEKNNFIANMSEELKNHLSPILSGAASLASRLAEASGDEAAAKLAEDARALAKQAKGLKKLVDDFSGQAGPTSGKTRKEKQSDRKDKTGKIKVLIIDDNKEIADMQAELLGFYGFDTLVCYDGPSALTKADDYRPEVALVDIGLPVMDGYEVARRLRTLGSRLNLKIKLIAATGYGQDEDKRRSREAGFDHHFVKPLDFDSLLRVLKA